MDALPGSLRAATPAAGASGAGGRLAVGADGGARRAGGRKRDVVKESGRKANEVQWAL